MKFFAHFIVILALIGAGISPACAFTSGEKNATVIDGITYIEICSGNDIIRIAIDAQGNRTTEKIDSSNSDDQPTHSAAFDECSFCFAQSHLKLSSVASQKTTAPYVRIRGGVLYGHDGQAYSYPISTGHGVRAPPSTLS